MAFVKSFTHRPKILRQDTPDLSTEKHTFLAELSEPTRQPKTDILNSPQCPKYFSTLPSDLTMFVVDIQTTQLEDSPQAFEVVVTYANRYESDGTGNQNGAAFTWIENPLQRPAVVEWGTYRTREVFDMAYNESEKLEVPVMTAAGEPILMEDEVDRRMIMIAKNVQSVNPLFAQGANYINKDTIRIGGHSFPPETMWLTDLNISSIIIENRIPHYRLSFRLMHRKEKWRRVVPHAGFYYRVQNADGSLGPVAPIMVQGQFPSKPVPLQPNGTLLVKMSQYIGMRKTTETERRQLFTPQELSTIIKDAKLTFRTKERIIFNGQIPLQ